MKRTLTDRLNARLDKSAGNDGCWIWTASTIRGYGQIGILVEGKATNNLAHRIAYELASGKKLTPEQCVLHRCDTPRCCNPKHLFLGDRNDNAKDKVSKNRQRNGIVPGERHGMSKMTDVGVLEMRRAYAAGEASQNELARRFGISQASVWAILNRRTWHHL